MTNEKKKNEKWTKNRAKYVEIKNQDTNPFFSYIHLI